MIPTELTVSLTDKVSARCQMRMGASIPDAKKCNFDIDAKRFLEGVGLFPPGGICTSVHLVREGNLLMVANWQEANLVDHARKADGER
jgi:hypothetical protein